MAGEVISAKLSQLEAFGMKVVTEFTALTARVQSLESAGGQPNIIEKILVNGIQLAVDGNKAVSFSVPTKVSQLENDTGFQNGTQVDEKLSGKADSGHDHDGRYFTKEQVNSAIAGKADTSHTHDDRYYTEREMDVKLGGKADAEHAHDDRYYAKSEVDDKLSDVADPAWDSISGKPTAFAPTAHTHDDRYYTEAEVDAKLTGVAASGHNHDDRYFTKEQVNVALAGKADTNHSHAYLPLSGGTMNGALNFANGTWNTVGDDAYMGDHNIGGGFCIMGANDITRLVLVNKDDQADYACIQFGGGNIDCSRTLGANITGHADGDLALSGGTLSGNIHFADIGDNATSAGITWLGSTDGASIYYQTTGADCGNLVLNLVDDSNCYLRIAANGEFKSYFSPTDGNFHGNVNGRADSAGYADSAGSAPANGGTATNAEYIACEGIGYARVRWAGQGGQPSWLFGSNDGVNWYVWNPSNFNVNYANSANYAAGAGNVGGYTFAAQTTDPGAGSALESNKVLIVYA